MRRSNSAITRTCAGGRLRSEARGNGAWWRLLRMRHAASVCARPCPPSRRRKCPDLIFVKPRFEVYKAVSAQIRAIFAEYTPLIEPLSLDEAYLDVTENLKGIASATQVAQEIRARIQAEMGLTASAGVSYNKFLAKLASDQNKPDGLFVITPGQGPAFVEALSVGRFHGVGPATEAKLHRLGIRTGADLKAQPLPFLEQHFGKAGPYFYAIARGIDDGPVHPDRIRKSIGAEATFFRDLVEFDDMLAELQPLLDKVWRWCERTGARGRTVTLKVKYADFRQITRSRSLSHDIQSRALLERISLDLLSPLLPTQQGVRLLGVTLSALATAELDQVPQLSLAL
jgi:DNA polymerase-4